MTEGLRDYGGGREVIRTLLSRFGSRDVRRREMRRLPLKGPGDAGAARRQREARLAEKQQTIRAHLDAHEPGWDDPRLRSRAGGHRTGPRLTADEEVRIVELVRRGLSWVRVAAEVGRSHSAITRVLRDHGLLGARRRTS
jgi:hypothetical protein